MALRINKDIQNLLKAARSGDVVDLDDVVIHRIGGRVNRASEVAIATPDEEQNYVRNFRLSDKSVDRDNDTIEPAGWELEDFDRNGAILWAHNNWEPPIAVRGVTGVQGDALFGDAEFIEDYDFSMMLLRLIDVGALQNCSVGFSAVEWTFNEERRGIDFHRQKLIEWSVVPVGSNVNAMIQAGKSMDLAPMLDWSQRWLDNDPKIGKAVADEEEMAMVVKALAPFAHRVDPGLPPSQRELPLIGGKSVDFKAAITYDQAHSGGTTTADEAAEWDGPSEVASAEVDDLQTMCTWVDDENPDIKSSYKLPHHRVDKTLVWNGVKAAMGALLGARGGTNIPDGDRRGVYDHLAKHYAEFDKEPPEFKASASEPLAPTKAGRVLSAKNVERLSKAHELLGEVLAAAQPEETDACGDDEKTAPELTAALLDELIGKASGEVADLLAKAREVLEPQTLQITRDDLKTMVAESVRALATPEEEPISLDEIREMTRSAVTELREDLLRRTGRLPR